jgi:hypothetical protein
MNNFYDILLNTDNLNETLEKYNGDTTLTYEISTSASVYEIDKKIDFSPLNTQKEIPFILYKKNYKIVHMDVGSIGTESYCSFFQNDFLYKSIVYALQHKCEIILGHTHPTFKDYIYGAIFSKIIYSDFDDIEDFILEDNYLYKYHIDNGMYKKFGGDYCDYFTLMKIFKQICNIGAVYNATMDSLGLYEIHDDGFVRCLRWE